MATELEALTLRLELQAKTFESNMAKVSKQFDAQAKSLERRATAAASKMQTAFGGVGQRISAGLRASFAGVAAALSGRELLNAADAFTRIQNNLKVAGLSGDQLTGTMERLYQIAQDNAVPLEGLSELYGRVAQAQTTLGASSNELVGFTSTVAQALRVSGKSASEASGALLQLGQSLSGGKIQAGEYNSLIDGLYPLLQAAAAGLKEAGGDVSKLTALVKDGKVSSQAFFRAIEAGAPILGQKLASATETSESGLTKFKNTMTLAVGELDRAIGFVSGFNDVLGRMGGGALTTAQAVGALADQLARFSGPAVNRAQAQGQAFLDANPRLRAALLATGDPSINARLGVTAPRAAGAGLSPGDAVAEAQREAARARAISSLPRQITPVSLSDYKVPGSGSGSKTASAYERETQAINEKIEALRVEASTVGQTTAAVEKAKIALELETAAKEANKAAGLGANVVTAAQRTEIERLSTAYAQAKVQLENMEQAQRDTIASMDAVRSTAGSTLGTFTNDIIEGTTAMEALKSAVDSVRTALVNAFANQLIAGLLGPTGAPAAGLLGSFFGRAGGGPVNAGQPYTVGESGRETFVPTTAGRIIPAGGGGSSITYAPTIDARGADAGAVVRLEAIVRRQAEELRTIAGAGRAQKRGMRA